MNTPSSSSSGESAKKTPVPMTTDHPDLHVLIKDEKSRENPVKHKLAGQRMTGADLILQTLADEGVRTMFGYSGGAILPTYDALYRYNESHPANERVHMVVAANEQGAGFMAGGFARATGKAGVCLVTSGPGATNCVTPVRDAAADSAPLVVICGQVARNSIGTDAFQEAPVYNIMSACAKHVFLVEEEGELEPTIRTAFKIAVSGRPGPVVIDVPKDIQNTECVFKGEGILDLKGYDRRLKTLENAHLTKKQCASFYKLLAKAQRPILYVGGGVVTSNAAKELHAFAKRFQIPVVTTLMGIGGFDTTDDLALHMLGMHGTAYANYAVDDCDFLIAVGARFDDRVAGNVDAFAPHASVAHIDIDAAEIGKVKRVDWSHTGDAKRALAELLAHAELFPGNFAEWAAQTLSMKKKHHLRYHEDTDLIQPPFVIDMLNQLTKGEAIICTGVGQHQMYSAQYFDFHQPRTFITSGCMGTMGFGLPSAIGAKLARPDKTVIDVDGDGSMRMNIGELETAITYNVPIKVVLLNNRADGMVRQWQDLYYGRRFSGTCKMGHSKDFVKEAEANGFTFARRVTEKSEVKKTLKAMLAYDGPAFVEFITDRDAYVFPMVGPGQGYKEMIEGPFITPRD
ncbi:MAG: acetolactate synthase large subunit [Candidatus Hydrogenedentes bacterium]|nr:acetolactate synthase large subunit [Candidatus Hydrogenedentota bacterium]